MGSPKRPSFHTPNRSIPYEKVWSKITPVGRAAFPTDMARAAVFPVSENARHLTGQRLVIDGGRTSSSPLPYEA